MADTDAASEKPTLKPNCQTVKTEIGCTNAEPRYTELKTSADTVISNKEEFKNTMEAAWTEVAMGSLPDAGLGTWGHAACVSLRSSAADFVKFVNGDDAGF